MAYQFEVDPTTIPTWAKGSVDEESKEELGKQQPLKLIPTAGTKTMLQNDAAEMSELRKRLAYLEGRTMALVSKASKERPLPTKVANPGPLGLVCFGMTTCALMYVEMEWVEPEFVDKVLCVAMMYGGLAQLIAGSWEIYNGNLFAGTAFSSYGMWWMSWALYGFLKKAKLLVSSAEFESAEALYLAQWGVFTFVFFICTLEKNRSLQFVFGTLVIGFFCLSAGVHHHNVKIAGGYFGFMAGAGALYTAFAEIVNETFQYDVLPGLKKTNSWLGDYYRAKRALIQKAEPAVEKDMELMKSAYVSGSPEDTNTSRYTDHPTEQQLHAEKHEIHTHVHIHHDEHDEHHGSALLGQFHRQSSLSADSLRPTDRNLLHDVDEIC